MTIVTTLSIVVSSSLFTDHSPPPQVHFRLPGLPLLLLPVQSVPPVPPAFPLPAGHHGAGETGETGQQSLTARLPGIAHRDGEKRIL